MVEKKSNVSFPVILCIWPLILIGANAAANVHGVETVRVIAADEPPEYDLDQIEEEVADGIKRSKRNYRLRYALLGAGASASAGNNCGSAHPQFALAETLCDVASVVGNAAEGAARRVDANQAIDNLNRTRLDSDPELAPQLAANIDKLLSSNLLQLQLAAAIENFVDRHTDISVVADDPAVVPGHQLTASLSRIEAVGNKVDSQISVRLHGEAVLASNRDGAIVDKYSYAVETPKYFIEGWSAGGIGLLAASVDDGIAKMAEVLAEEVLLVVTSPHQRGKGYLITPVSPKFRGTLRSDGFINPAGDFRPTGTLTPTFKWEDFGDAYGEDPLYTDVAASELEVSYDVRIYRARPAGSGAALLIAAELLYENRGILGEEITPEIEFDACTPYLWTVRSRFVGRNKTHLTYWSGDYKEKRVEEFRQYRTSERAGVRTARSISAVFGMDLNEMWREEAQYFPFLATQPGQKCSREDIRAAMVRRSP